MNDSRYQELRKLRVESLCSFERALLNEAQIRLNEVQKQSSKTGLLMKMIGAGVKKKTLLDAESQFKEQKLRLQRAEDMLRQLEKPGKKKLGA